MSASTTTKHRALALILAIDKNGLIGSKGQLPWSYPEDHDYFLRTTKGHAVILGRRTWEETGKPLPDRTNIVVSKTFVAPPNVPAGPAVLSASSLEDALAKAWAIDDEPFVIGGVRLFEEAMPRATRLYVTDIPGEHAGDTYLKLDRSLFAVVHEETTQSGLRFSILEPLARSY